MASSAKKRSKGSKASDGKRKRKHSGSDEDGPAFLSSKYAEPPASKIYNSRFSHSAPAELFRKDLISAMKLPDNEPLTPDDYWLIEDSWKPEWEKGVQVPVNPEALPEPSIRILRKKRKEPSFKLNKKLIRITRDAFYNPDIHKMSYTNTLAERTCRYDMDDVDLKWLTMVNEEREDFGLDPLEEIVMEQIIEEFEVQAYVNFQEAIKSEEGLGVEYDEDAICDVCRSPDSHDGNEMVFCDSCNICVHQICYGITKIPEGSWICRTCALGIRPACVLCPNRGGAMKTTRCGQKWAHVGCAVWIPEVSFFNFIKMEPIIKVAHIPPSRWALVCSLCKEKAGACIQCSEKSCKTAFHVTCAFKEGLQMRATVKNTDSDDDTLKAFCKKHGKQKRAMFSDSEDDDELNRTKNLRESLTSEERANLRQQKIHEKEAEFYNYVNIDEVVEMFPYDRTEIEIIFNYWKLKRRANWNRPLLPPKIDTENNCSEEDSPIIFQKKLVHHRQDLERARNLCYMVSKREKLTKTWVKCKEQLFLKQAEVLTEEGDKLSKDELEAVLNINIGDIAYEKKHCVENGYTPNMFSAVSSLLGEDMAKSLLVKSSQKRDRTKCEKTPNPYAKHYLNGLLKRSQRWFATVDKQRKSSHLPNTVFIDDKSNLNLSFQSSSDHFVSDDGLEASKDYDDSLTHRTLFMSQMETKYEASCDNACANLGTYHDTDNDYLNKVNENYNNEGTASKELCFPAFTEIKSEGDCISPNIILSESRIEEDLQLETQLDFKTVDVTTEYDDDCELNRGLKISKSDCNIVKENKHETPQLKPKSKSVSSKPKKCTEKSVADKFDITSNLDNQSCMLSNGQSTENCIVEEEFSKTKSDIDLNAHAEDKACGNGFKVNNVITHDFNSLANISESKIALQRSIELQDDEKLNLPVRVIVKSEVPFLTSENESFTVVENNRCNKLNEKSIKAEANDMNLDKCGDKTVHNKSQNSNSFIKDKPDANIRPFSNKDSPVRTQSPISVKASENGVVKLNKASPKHNVGDKSQTASKSTSRLKHSNSSHPVSSLSVNKQHSSSSLIKCQEKNSSVSSKEDFDLSEQKDANSHCKDVSNETPMPKKDMLRGYKIPKKSKSDKPEENSLDLKRGNSPLSPLPDITSSNLSGYHTKAKPSWRKLEPRPNKVIQTNSQNNLNGDVNQEPEPRLVLKLKKDTSDPESQRWKTDPIAYNRSGMPNWINDYQSMPQGLLPRPYLPVRPGPWPRLRNRGGYRRIPMNYGNNLRYS